MTRKTNTARTFPIVLKTIVSDAVAQKTLSETNADPKKIRAKLRVAFRDVHAKNTSWVANNAREYDAIRSAFDANYALRIAKPARKTRAKPAARVTTDAE